MSAKVLFMTIGTGQADKLEETLYLPILKSIGSDQWAQVKLLPSQETIIHAGTIRDRVPEVPVEIHPLPEANAENDPDACFQHFERIIAATLGQGYRPESCVADITRGTKAMSAGLAMAAVRRDIPVLRYLAGQRDAAAQGTVLSGTEQIVNAHTRMVTASRRLDAARGLFARGNFSAVGTLLDQGGPQAVPDSLRPQINAVKAVAAFCAMWDRLDYVSAAERAPDMDALTLPDDWSGLVPTAASVRFVQTLAADTQREEDLRTSDNFTEMARHVGRLCADLIANARRRVAQAQYEDASLRVYRITELIGQAALFIEGYDSEFMPADDDKVIAFITEMEKKKSAGDIRPAKGKNGGFSFPQQKNVRFLNRLSKPIGKRLQDFSNREDVTARNQSLLIHGFKATGLKDAEALKAHLDQLEDLLRQAFPDDADDWLATAKALPPARAERS